MNKNVRQRAKFGKFLAAAVSFFALFPAANPCYAAEPASFASDGVSFEGGTGNGAEMWRIGITKNWDKKWRMSSGNWYLGGYWEAQFGQWSGPDKRTISDLGITPVFRFQEAELSKISPYAEAAIGFHVITPTRLDDARHFGGAFQFGDLVGAGARFGPKGKYDLGLRFQHLSNGGLKKPNDGINFTQLRFVYHLE